MIKTNWEPKEGHLTQTFCQQWGFPQKKYVEAESRHATKGSQGKNKGWCIQDLTRRKIMRSSLLGNCSCSGTIGLERRNDEILVNGLSLFYHMLCIWN